MKFLCEGFDRSGRAVRETIEAADAQEASELLHRRAIFASQIKPAEQHGAKGRARKRTQGSTARMKAVAGFMRQLSVLVATGTPMTDAIVSIERQLPDNAFRAVIESVRERVEEGAQFSDALALHPLYFDGVCRSLVSAGESGGKMDEMLARLSDLLRQQVKTRHVVQSAMIYPSLLLCVGLVVLVAMLGFVLPRFEGLFKTLGSPLPTSTRWLMLASAFVREWWFAVLGALGACAVGARLYLATPGGVRAVAHFMLRAPRLGLLTRNIATARIARVLGVLLNGKVALVDSLRLLRQSAPGPAYADLLGRAEECVTRGDNLSAALADERLITPGACEAVRSGERSGRIGPVLMQVADALDEENELTVKTLSGLIEPLILIVMGVFVGGVAISMFLPLFDLTASGGGAAP